MSEKFTVFGAGYVGMSLAILLSQLCSVRVIDVDKDKVALINKRQSHLNERDIKKYLKNKGLKIKASTFNKKKKINSEFIIIAVPTNFCEVTESFDTSIIESIIRQLNEQHCTSTIVIKSTIPLGFTDKLNRKYPELEIIYSPEFLREGKAIFDNLHPSRIVVGSSSASAKQFASYLADLAESSSTPVVLTDNITAEAIKLGSNTYLAMRVAFFNELDTLAYQAKINASDLIRTICYDPRIGDGYNNPSFAYGGYCLPKDVKQLASSCRNLNLKLPLLESLTVSNENRLTELVKIILAQNPKSIGIFRLQMKSGSDNARESANLRLASRLLEEHGKIEIYEPYIQVDGILSEHLVSNLDSFLSQNSIIIANRWSDELSSVSNKVICRDIYHEN